MPIVGKVGTMLASQLIFFVIWLMAALAAAVVIYAGWQRLYVKVLVESESVRPGSGINRP